jgi:hypothetical protein
MGAMQTQIPPNFNRYLAKKQHKKERKSTNNIKAGGEERWRRKRVEALIDQEWEGEEDEDERVQKGKRTIHKTQQRQFAGQSHLVKHTANVVWTTLRISVGVSMVVVQLRTSHATEARFAHATSTPARAHGARRR